MSKKISAEVVVMRDIKDVWKGWIDPERIKKWNFASDTWYCPSVKNDFYVGENFHIEWKRRKMV